MVSTDIVYFEQQMFRYIIGLQISLLGLKGLWGELPRVGEGGGRRRPLPWGRGGGRSTWAWAAAARGRGAEGGAAVTTTTTSKTRQIVTCPRFS